LLAFEPIQRGSAQSNAGRQRRQLGIDGPVIKDDLIKEVGRSDNA
jgi:hypothetical protein